MRTIALLVAFICPMLLHAQDTIPPTIDFEGGLDTFLLDVYDAYLEEIDLNDNATSQSFLQNSLRLTGSYVKRFPNGPSDTLGLFYCDYTLKDSAGNSASQRRWIKVVDREAPLLEMTDGEVLIVPKWDYERSLIEYSVKDNYYQEGEIDVEIADSTVNDSTVGVYEIEMILTDPSDNSMRYTIYVVIVERIQPNVGETNSTSLESSVYPNPSTGMLYLDAANHVKKVGVYNQQGQLVKQFSNPGNSFDLQDLPVGLYWVQVSFIGFTTSHQILKQ